MKSDTATSALLTLDLGIESPEHVILEGTQSGLAIGRLGPGESYAQEVAICFLARGHFEISAEVIDHDTVRGDRRAGFGHLIAVVQQDSADSRTNPTIVQNS